MKKWLLYILISAACIVCYVISTSYISKQYATKQISYRTDSATEVYMVWAQMNGVLPSKDHWPDSSNLNGRLIWTKMSAKGDQFTTTLNLSASTIIYYWMVQKKDRAGNELDVWDSGSDNAKYNTEQISYNRIFHPGYFILLAGFLPLVLHFIINRRSKPKNIDDKFKIRDYIPQFDSIRAIAVILVIIHHWVAENHFLNLIPNGRIGVNIFYVLSGFLITRILLKSKQQIAEQNLNNGTALKNFYVRRTLRIFPIYYLLLIILWSINDPEIKANGIYYFTYTSNYLFYALEGFPSRVSHLWTLAVEEQFYIIWPWLIIFINRKSLPYLILAFLIIGISTNFLVTGKLWWVELLTPACFDAFAMGGGLAYLSMYRQDIILTLQPVYKWIFAFIVLLFILDVTDHSFLPPRTTHSLLAAAILYYCLFKNNALLPNFILKNKWLIRVGKVSYGIYLYHLFIPELWMWVNNKFALWGFDLFYNKAMPAIIKPLWLFIQEFCLLMLMCIVSWKLIEKPLNNLKKYFENRAMHKPKSSIDAASA